MSLEAGGRRSSDGMMMIEMTSAHKERMTYFEMTAGTKENLRDLFSLCPLHTFYTMCRIHNEFCQGDALKGGTDGLGLGEEEEETPPGRPSSLLHMHKHALLKWTITSSRLSGKRCMIVMYILKSSCASM
jgi:hypothetical protein